MKLSDTEAAVITQAHELHTQDWKCKAFIAQYNIP